MKKKYIGIVVLLALIFVTIWVIRKKGRSTIEGAQKEFAISDTHSVDKLVLADKKGKKVTLQRENGKWMVAGKFPARHESIELILQALLRVEVRYPVGDKAKPNVLKLLATGATRCDVYQNGKRTRIWYIGPETMDLTGTYMLMADPETEENYPDPFVLELPGFYGFLLPRFYTDEQEWRERAVLAIKPDRLRQVKLTAFEMPDSSFTIDIENVRRVSLKDAKGNAVSNFDTLAVKQYLSYFMRLHVEGYYTDSKKSDIDSIKKAKPFLLLEVTDTDNKRYSFSFLHKKPDPGKETIDEQPVKYDPDYLYMWCNNGKDLTMVQFFVWGKVLTGPSYFRLKSVKK